MRRSKKRHGPGSGRKPTVTPRASEDEEESSSGDSSPDGLFFSPTQIINPQTTTNTSTEHANDNPPHKKPSGKYVHNNKKHPTQKAQKNVPSITPTKKTSHKKAPITQRLKQSLPRTFEGQHSSPSTSQKNVPSTTARQPLWDGRYLWCSASCQGPRKKILPLFPWHPPYYVQFWHPPPNTSKQQQKRNT